MTGHPTPEAVTAYATGGAVDDVAAWAIEAHLDLCARCRAVLAAAVAAPDRELLDRVGGALGGRLDAGPAPAPAVRTLPALAARVLPGRAARALAGRAPVARAVVPWLLTAIGVVAVAALFDRASDGAPSLVLLLAPVAPLLPVAAAWSRGTDPAWEIVSSAARCGLRLLLHRTLAVLVVLLPGLALAGWGSGRAPGAWLLPGLAFTAGSLALGGAVGVPRAAALLAALWTAGVVAPSLARARLPGVLQPGGWWLWAVATAVAVAVLVLRGDDHLRLRSRA